MDNKSQTDKAWDELMEAASVAPKAAPLSAHPFAATMGAGPYALQGFHIGKASCTLCGRSIANVYQVRNGAGTVYPVGSECILKLTHSDTASLVRQVRARKKQFDREKRAAAKAKRDAENAGQCLETSRSQYPAEFAFLESYTGDFDFYLSLRGQLFGRGFLSERQWECVRNALAKQAARELERAKPAVARVFTLAAGETIMVTKFLAHKIGEHFGLKRPHFAIEILAVSDETLKAYKVRAKLSAKRTARCCVCGRTLDNAHSIAAGIGPICAEKTAAATVEALDAQLSMVKVEMELWIPKSQITERVNGVKIE